MPAIKRIVLDVLKPHHPNAVELAQAIAALASDYQVNLKVTAVDERTESAEVTVEGQNINFESVNGAITSMGATVHSIDAVSVASDDATNT
jgi:uncharacterized protein